jgi:aryl-alcohol dehydrogenase-like predicted oxidoreductase
MGDTLILPVRLGKPSYLATVRSTALGLDFRRERASVHRRQLKIRPFSRGPLPRYHHGMNSLPTAPPTFFTFGSMSLGSDLARIQEHIRIARKAMDARVWFHSSPTYNRGFTYMILRMAFDEARHLVPPMIIKIRCGSPRLLRFEVEDALRRLGIECIDVAQLVFTETGGASVLVDDFLSGGPIKAVCDQLRNEGKVRQFCPQIDRPSSPQFLSLAKQGAFDGFVLYLNPLERDVDDVMWALLQERRTPLWALRTVAGALGEPARLQQHRGRHPEDRLIPIVESIAQIAARSGNSDWTEFCLRYARSVPHLQTTIGGTGDLAHLDNFLAGAKTASPLPDVLLAEIDAARRRLHA